MLFLHIRSLPRRGEQQPTVSEAVHAVALRFLSPALFRSASRARLRRVITAPVLNCIMRCNLLARETPNDLQEQWLPIRDRQRVQRFIELERVVDGAEPLIDETIELLVICDRQILALEEPRMYIAQVVYSHALAACSWRNEERLFQAREFLTRSSAPKRSRHSQ